jgi:PTH1 family peptidyl-tRNA hydrolase
MADDASPWLVVGLGNPGPGYAGNRHNVGAMVVDELVRRHGSGALRKHRTQAKVSEARLGSPGVPGNRMVLSVPLQFMNESGGAVVGLLRYYGVDASRLIVVHDELDIPSGEVRLKLGGGEGGHNGLRSVSSAVGTKDYLRVRVGIGRPPGRMDPAAFVLRDFGAAERSELPMLISDAADAVESLVEDGLVPSQQRFHSPR